MTSTRELVLQNLLNRQRLTINELAEAVEINPISVRHHIARLEADGFVSSEQERHGVGRPRRVYYLTQAGMELFPSRYVTLSSRLVEQLKENLSQELVASLFTKIGVGLAEDRVSADSLAKLSTHDRLDLVKQLLVKEGFTVEIEENSGQYVIKETSCPYVHVGQEHREVCLVDLSLISTIMSTPVQRTQCILDGHACCAYVAAPNLIEVSETKA